MATRLINDLIGKQIITKAAYPVNLYQLLATAKQDGVGLRVMPEEWLAYGNTGKNYFTVTNVNLTPGFSQGIVCAKKTWSGTLMVYFC